MASPEEHHCTYPIVKRYADGQLGKVICRVDPSRTSKIMKGFTCPVDKVNACAQAMSQEQIHNIPGGQYSEELLDPEDLSLGGI